ncbi:hypothetical protein NFC79_06440 [Providencia stuartii]|nr:hypothetical protein NFC79_06440 [Providencia stuartii]
MSIKNYDITFEQEKFRKHAQNYRNKDKIGKMTTSNEINHSLGLGYCYGFSHEFLVYSSINKEQEYIKQLNYLYTIINENIYADDPIGYSKKLALKIHANALLDYYLRRIILVQGIEENAWFQTQFFSKNFTYPTEGKTLSRYMSDSFSSDYGNYNLDLYKQKNIRQYAKFMYEMQEIKKKIFIDALSKGIENFDTNEERTLLLDPWFMGFYEKYKNKKILIDFSVQDANYFRMVISKSIERDNYLRQELFDRNSGLRHNEKEHTNIDRSESMKWVSLEQFLKRISNETLNGKESLFYRFKSKNHAMAIVINYENNDWVYSFFDPNEGIIKKNSKEDFFSFMREFISDKSEIYEIDRLSSGDYSIAYTKYEKRDLSLAKYEKLNFKEIQITANALLVENKQVIYLDNEKTKKITYKKLDAKSNVLKLKIKDNKKTFYIYTNEMDGDILSEIIMCNLSYFSGLKSDVFISKYGEIYNVDKNFDMSKYRSVSSFSDSGAEDYISVNLHLTPRKNSGEMSKIGIPESHQKAISRVANEYNIVIGIRPVDPKSTSLIESGMYSSKGLAIKGKSSDWGPHSGFIPIFQQYAKASARSESGKYNDYIHQSISQGKAIAVHLEITNERVNELIQFETITQLEKIHDGEYKKTTSMVDGKEKVFLLKRQGDNWQVYYQDGVDIRPFEVIGAPKTGKAMTADYDMFSIIFPISELEHYVKVKEMQSWAEWKLSVNDAELTENQKILYSNEAEYNKQEGKDNGIINERIKEIKRKLNKELGLREGYELIHHGADDANPASAMGDNFPITFFLPDNIKKANGLAGGIKSIEHYFSMNSQGAIIISNVEELSNFQQLLINEGYRAPLNKKWSEGDNSQFFDPQRKLSSSFIEAGNNIKRKKSIISTPKEKTNSIDNEAEKLFGQPIGIFDTENNAIGSYSFTESEPHKIKSLLEQIAVKNISIKEINSENHSYLNGYFTDENGILNYHKLVIAASDPLIAPKVNQFFNSNDVTSRQRWSDIFDRELPTKIQIQAHDACIILQALNDGTTTLKDLSLKSRNQLESLFPSISGLDSGKVLSVINNENEFLLLKNHLTEISQLNDSNFIGENAPLKDMKLQYVIEQYADSLMLKNQQFNNIVNKKNNEYSDIKLNKVNHNSIRGLRQSNNYDVKMGELYGVEFQLAGEESAGLFFERKTELERKQQRGTLSDGEAELLQKIKNYTEDVIQSITKNGIEVADQSILSVIDVNNRHYHSINNSLLIIKGKSASYTVNHTIHDGKYIYSLYDPHGFQLSIKNVDADLAKKQFHQLIINYFNDEIILSDGRKITRSEYAGFSSDSNGTIRADMKLIDFDAPAIQKNIGQYKAQKEHIIKNKHFSDPVNGWVYIDGEKISLSKLQGLGVTIDGRPLTLLDTMSEGWSHKVRFNAESLAAELTMLKAQSEDDMSLLKILHKKSNDIDSIIHYETDFKNTHILKKQLKIIAKDIDIKNTKQSTELITNLHKAGTKLSRFQRIGNRAGQVMGGAGAVQALISVHSLINQLDNPDLTDEERLEVEKQLYITCGSAFANYGDMMLQPVLLKIANSARTSSLVCSRLAAGVVIVFNLVGMGFDAYQAYDNLSKLDSVTDPKQRQDLMVNAALSIASFVVNGVTVVGVLVASSTIPVMGLVIGGILLVGGWVYNGVRAVENIKQQIDISWSRELEEGIRGALGLEPTLRTKNELAIAQYLELAKQEEWLKSKEIFKQLTGPEGYQHHLKIIEKPIMEPEERFYLVCNGERMISGYQIDYFGGTKKTSGYYDQFVEYTKQGAPSFTQEEIDILQTEYVLNVNGEVKKRTSDDLPSNFRAERKPVLDRKLVTTESSSEYLNFNSSYDSVLLSEFIKRHGINDRNHLFTLNEQLDAPNSGKPKLYSIIKKFKNIDKNSTKIDPYYYIGMELNDTGSISQAIIDCQDGGSSFDTGNGIDIIIGKGNQKNAFQIFSGGKYLAGGDKNDIFYLNDKTILDASHLEMSESIINKNYKYLDGQGGNDTLIIKDKSNLVKYITVDLESNFFVYSSGRELNDSHESVADIKNIENIIILGHKTNDEIYGNGSDNVLDGGYGRDEIWGYGGDDNLILSYGTAYGGDGNDTYYIRRYDWEIEAESYFRYKKVYDIDKKLFEEKKILNNESGIFHSRVVNIDEESASSSVVNLGYDLKEIKKVYVDENNLVLEISMPLMNLDGKDLTNFSGVVKVNLNNIYSDSDEGKKLNHNYQIRTRDGFFLNSKIKEITNLLEKKDENIFEIVYLQPLDQVNFNEKSSAHISVSDSAMILNGNKLYVKPSWGDFKWSGGIQGLTYEGSENNDVLNYVSGGNNIKVSLGQDIYRLDNIENNQQDIVFDFSTVRGLYSEKDKVVLLLPTINGFELEMEGSKITLKDRFDITKFSIRLENFDRSMQHAVMIQDKHSNIFNVNLQKDKCVITPITPIKKETDDSDSIILPKGYIPKNGLVNGLDGDDVIINYSSHVSFISGGLGDDIITSAGEFNVLYGGVGENELTGGEGNDLLLSSVGFDTLQGGKGDDHYLIDGSQAGLVYIDDLEGNNHIHLIGFTSEAVIQEKDDAIYHRYLSSAGKIVVIKRMITDKNQVHLYSEPTDHLGSLMQGGMDKLFNYLHTRYLEEKSMGNIEEWEPISELADDLQGITSPKRIGLDAKSIWLNLSSGKDFHRLAPSSTIEMPWIINALEGDDIILDESKQGRIIKGGKGNDELIILGGENVLYGGEGNDKLIGGENRDLLVSTDGTDILLGGKGNDTYLVYGHGKGDVNIHDSEGNNHVFLINFKYDSLIEELTPQGYTKTSIQSSTGRWVHIHHQNHLMSTLNQTNIQFHHKTHESWQDKSEQTVNKLSQLMAEQRYEYESTSDNALKTALAEKRLTHFEWVDYLVNGKI